MVGDTAKLYCDQCGYDLTGLNESCCPECGTWFDRATLAAKLERATAHAMPPWKAAISLAFPAAAFIIGFNILAWMNFEWLWLTLFVVFILYAHGSAVDAVTRMANFRAIRSNECPLTTRLNRSRRASAALVWLIVQGAVALAGGLILFVWLY